MYLVVLVFGSWNLLIVILNVLCEVFINFGMKPKWRFLLSLVHGFLFKYRVLMRTSTMSGNVFAQARP